MQLTIATLLWSPNETTEHFSQMYNEEWVDKLYRGFKRNLNVPFDFICFTDRHRKFEEDAVTTGQAYVPNLGKNGYGDCILPYGLSRPMILVGLDTVVVGNIDLLAQYVLAGGEYALPRDPFWPSRACNGVALVPEGMGIIAAEHQGENDMEHVRNYPHVFIDDLFPGQVVSYKCHVKDKGWDGVKIVYFHGKEKPHELTDPMILQNWR